MASKIWGSAGFSLANWRPAKDQMRQMLEDMHVRVFDIREEANPFGGSRLKVYLETAGLALTDLFDALDTRRTSVTIPIEFYSGEPDTPAPTPGHNFAPRINQKVIDLFRAVFGSPSEGVDFWAIVTRAGLAYMGASLAARSAPYTGPDVEDLPLTEDEKARLIAAL
jgi:hypothetical protein